MKIAIIGANGQLGFDLVRVFKNSEDKIVPLTPADIDVTDFKLSEKTLKNIQPDVVINCAAYVRVDDAEDFADKAFTVNALGASGKGGNFVETMIRKAHGKEESGFEELSY